jgi:hypothetical protein
VIAYLFCAEEKHPIPCGWVLDPKKEHQSSLTRIEVADLRRYNLVQLRFCCAQLSVSEGKVQPEYPNVGVCSGLIFSDRPRESGAFGQRLILVDFKRYGIVGVQFGLMVG